MFFNKIIPGLPLLLCLVGAGHCLICTICYDRQSCGVGGVPTECNNQTVQESYSRLAFANPKLNNPLPSVPVYLCFHLDMMYRSPLSGSMVAVFEQGCTHAYADLCNDWIYETAISACTHCLEDNCNAIAGSTSTPLASSSSVETSSLPASTSSSLSPPTSTAALGSTSTVSSSSSSYAPPTSTASPGSTSPAPGETSASSKLDYFCWLLLISSTLALLLLRIKV